MAEQRTQWDVDVYGPGIETRWDVDVYGPGSETKWDVLADVIGRWVRVVWASARNRVTWLNPRYTVRW